MARPATPAVMLAVLFAALALGSGATSAGESAEPPRLAVSLPDVTPAPASNRFT